MYNLLNEQWIPVRRRSGQRQRIAPWQITDNPKDPIGEIDFPRPDFNGAMLQFLIGLFQLALAPSQEREWTSRYSSHPHPDALRDAIRPFEDAFELGGDRYRFMQDPTVADTDSKSASAILIEAPGQQALRENKAFFIKEGFVRRLCRSCAAAALYTMQTNAPAGGKGFRTSLRGGGPLTTVLLSDTLWGTIVLNLMPLDKPSDADARLFPWLGPVATSEKQEVIVPDDVAPYHEYWGMPRRIFLHFDEVNNGACDICGESDVHGVSSYSERNYGPNYQSGVWKHPLTPVYATDQMPRSPVHASSHCLQYRYWPAYVLPGEDGSSRPAMVVERYLGGRDRDLRDAMIPTLTIRLQAFGYDMDNMKARCWYEGSMPLFTISEEQREQYLHRVQGMIEAASLIASNCLMGVRRALFGRINSVTKSGAIKWDLPKGSSADAALPQSVSDSFWQNTETEFYKHIINLREVVGNQDGVIPLMKSWNAVLARQAETLFDAIVESADYTRTDPKPAVLARMELGKANYGNKIHEMLNIPRENVDLESATQQ